MAQFDRFFGNMSDEEYEEWKSLSPEERKEIARELALEKRQAKVQKEADDMAKAKAFRKKAIIAGAKRANTPTPKQPVFTEDYSLKTSPEGLAAKALADEKLKITEREPLQLTDYRGQKGTAKNLSEIPLNTGEGRLSLHPTARSLQKNALSDPRVIDEVEEVDETFVDEPRVVAPPNPLLSKFQEHIAKKSDLEKGLEDRAQTEEFADAQKTTFDDEGNVLTLSPEDAEMERIRKGVAENTAMVAEENAREEELAIEDEYEEKYGEKDEGLGFYNKTKLAAAAFLKSKLDANVFMGEKKKNKVIDALVPPIEPPKKKDGGLINLEKKKVDDADKKLKASLKDSKKKNADVTGDFVKFDKNGYPIYKKGSKWSKSFNDAFAKSLEQEGNKTFSWTGHDGVSRSYTNERAVKDIVEAPTPKKNDPSTLIPQLSDYPSPHKGEQVYDPSVLMPQITKYKAAKTEPEKEEVLKNTTKDERAAIREEADPKCFWIDPRTGFALNKCKMDKLIDRDHTMKLAALLQPADRAIYLQRRNLITKEDFDAIVKTPNQKKALALKQANLSIKLTQLKIANEETKGKVDPKRKELLTMYTNAVSQDDYDMQILLGKKLGFPADVLKLTTDNRRKYELTKLSTKKGADGFKNTFYLPYSKVSDKKDAWIKRASAIVQTEGRIDAIGLDGKKYVDRRGYFRSFGLFEQKEMKTKGNKGELLSKMPFFQRIRSNPKFFGSDDKFSPSKFVNDTIAYEKHLMDALVYMGMDKTYTGRWGDMLAYISDQEQPDELTPILSAE